MGCMQRGVHYSVETHDRGAAEPPPSRTRPTHVDDAAFASANKEGHAISQQDLAEQVAHEALARQGLPHVQHMQHEARLVNERLMQAALDDLHSDDDGDGGGDDDDGGDEDMRMHHEWPALTPRSLVAASQATASTAAASTAAPLRQLAHKGTPLGNDGAPGLCVAINMAGCCLPAGHLSRQAALACSASIQVASGFGHEPGTSAVLAHCSFMPSCWSSPAGPPGRFPC